MYGRSHKATDILFLTMARNDFTFGNHLEKGTRSQVLEITSDVHNSDLLKPNLHNIDLHKPNLHEYDSQKSNLHEFNLQMSNLH